MHCLSSCLGGTWGEESRRRAGDCLFYAQHCFIPSHAPPPTPPEQEWLTIGSHSLGVAYH